MAAHVFESIEPEVFGLSQRTSTSASLPTGTQAGDLLMSAHSPRVALEDSLPNIFKRIPSTRGYSFTIDSKIADGTETSILPVETI